MTNKEKFLRLLRVSINNQILSKLFGNYEEAINKAEILLKNEINQRTDQSYKQIFLHSFMKRYYIHINNVSLIFFKY